MAASTRLVGEIRRVLPSADRVPHPVADGLAPGQTGCSYMRARRVGVPVPDRSSRGALRPAMTRMSDASGPSTGAPLPADQSESVAEIRRPAMRFLAWIGKPMPFTVSATVSNVAGGTVRERPVGRRISPL